jgi:phage shock protein E
MSHRSDDAITAHRRDPSTGLAAAASALRFESPRLRTVLRVCFALVASGGSANAQEVQIESLSRNGLLTWTNASLSVTCRVEWAASVDGLWSSSWDALTNIVITNRVTERSVPMFYRVVCSAPPAPMITNISALAALALVASHPGDTNFAILDVRTPTEYAPRHIKGAVNLDFNSTTFKDNLGKLDRAKSYLVYCASGNRSRQATEVMRQLGFLQVYNMTVGFGAFAALAGALAYLEP